MFTGIVTNVGTIKSSLVDGDMKAQICCDYDIETIDIGASIACDGVCLTVVDTFMDGEKTVFSVDISRETLDVTNLGAWQEGRAVNLERAMKIGDEIGGHLVSGHVDGLATIIDIKDDAHSTRIMMEAPDALAKFIAAKGSLCLNGTSLTVNHVDGNRFDVNLIQHTKAVTTWGQAALGDKVNLEIDMMARYVARLHEFAS